MLLLIHHFLGDTKRSFMLKKVLPFLSSTRPVSDDAHRYLDLLVKSGFVGDVERDLARRLIAGTDNSVYQLLPEAIIYPKNDHDVNIALSILSMDECKGVSLTPRGGGTGTNGQSLTTGISMDLSRYFSRVDEVNLEEGWAWVQAGVVLDQLNHALEADGVFFAPNLSPSSRATIGGMINTDAAGKGSRIYGKTSDHILAIEMTLVGGEEVLLNKVSGDKVRELAEQTPDGFEACYALPLMELVDRSAQEIEEIFPKLSRFMTGYNLKMMYDQERDELDLTRLIAGSEGTLGVVRRAKVKLTPLPTSRRLIVFGYARFQDALGSARLLLDQEPSAIETIDETILSLARVDASYHLVRGALEGGTLDLEVAAAINLVEFEGISDKAVEEQVDSCLKQVIPHYGEEDAPIGHHLAFRKEDQSALWGLRKRGVGLLAARPGDRKPVAFVEDTVVPPEHLAEYIEEFTSILDDEGVAYGLFGHVDVGCLHVRPALNLRDTEDEERFLRISDRVADLVQSYGGLIWGEHGKGMRSAYSPTFFGKLYPVLQSVKAIFDPDNQLNPGKVATPAGTQAELLPLASPLRGHRDRLIHPEALQEFEATVNCNGNGQCFDYHPQHLMCPSMRVTNDRLHSPKGRAGVMRAWLAALAESQHHLQDELGHHMSPMKNVVRSVSQVLSWPVSMIRKRVAALRQSQDLSTQVYEAMNGCLSCKACATACPVKVDVPSFKSRFLFHYYQRYPRPIRDYLVSLLEEVASQASHLSLLWNWGARSWLGKIMSQRVVGLVDPPQLSSRSALKQLADQGVTTVSRDVLINLTASEREQSVLLIPDTFNTFFDAGVLVSAYEALTQLGFRVFLAPFSSNGKGAHVKGRLHSFHRQAKRHLKKLTPLATCGVPVICLDPAVALTYRDEYEEVYGGELPFEVLLVQEWLSQHLSDLPNDLFQNHQEVRLFGHCTERSLSPNTYKEWTDIFTHMGAQFVGETVGCCGMCGVYGHEREHEESSKQLFEMSWREPLLRAHHRAHHSIATGYSCRTQVKRCAPELTTPLHPLGLINIVLKEAASQDSNQVK